MASKRQVDDILLLLSVQLAQPGLLGDVVQAYQRLEPPDAFSGHVEAEKADVRARLEQLVQSNLIWLYAERRYMLTRIGERYIGSSGLRVQLDGRRLYLLKETRRASLRKRSDTRNRPQQQRS